MPQCLNLYTLILFFCNDTAMIYEYITAYEDGILGFSVLSPIVLK
jgi:hypothetical protein